VVAAKVFAVPGLSASLLDAVARDYGLLQATVAVIALWMVAVVAIDRAACRRLENSRRLRRAETA
jgi:ABC-type dipeptide/oligopeptide/nickel transport system permease component